jgi:hypothetical protein
VLLGLNTSKTWNSQRGSLHFFSKNLHKLYRFRAKTTLLNDLEVWDFYTNLTDGSNRALYANTFGIKYFKPPYLVLKEKIISDYIGAVMPMNFFLFESYNEKIIQLTESGIIEKILRQKPEMQEESQPVVLSFDHLLIWFMLWAGFLGIASAVFVGEILVRKLPKVIKWRK